MSHKSAKADRTRAKRLHALCVQRCGPGAPAIEVGTLYHTMTEQFARMPVALQEDMLVKMARSLEIMTAKGLIVAGGAATASAK